ncbi:hypothetical protein [Pseudoclavibacter sp. VKM Ac-2888]|uniref:hypothetical protein n=1 Tax=Pseudoclavibacter sp. VKM Ac-2888 TaxID=2783830 RepID=UPI00188C384D|nr:hypothetical protein [Pseudoclavibacter sp. VKM Ac-2888]MBF4549357.1 hypothetical protein [Pseudoclavibacter sp. VKM Ac-2888]
MTISSDAAQRREASRGNGTTGGQFGHQQHSAPAPLTIAEPGDGLLSKARANREIDLTDDARGFDDERVSMMTLMKYDPADTDSTLVLDYSENPNWDKRFTHEQLQQHDLLIADAYSDWFDADVDDFEYQEDGDSNLSLSLTARIPDEELSDETVGQAAWNLHARFANETDPGTFGAEYIGAEIDRRIETAENPNVRAGIHEWTSNRGHAGVGVTYREKAAYFRGGDHLVKIDRDGHHWRAHIPIELNNARGREFDQAEADGKYEWIRHEPAETAARTNGLPEGA